MATKPSPMTMLPMSFKDALAALFRSSQTPRRKFTGTGQSLKQANVRP